MNFEISFFLLIGLQLSSTLGENIIYGYVFQLLYSHNFHSQLDCSAWQYTQAVLFISCQSPFDIIVKHGTTIQKDWRLPEVVQKLYLEFSLYCGDQNFKKLSPLTGTPSFLIHRLIVFSALNFLVVFIFIQWSVYSKGLQCLRYH